MQGIAPPLLARALLGAGRAAAGPLGPEGGLLELGHPAAEAPVAAPILSGRNSPGATALAVLALGLRQVADGLCQPLFCGFFPGGRLVSYCSMECQVRLQIAPSAPPFSLSCLTSPFQLRPDETAGWTARTSRAVDVMHMGGLKLTSVKRGAPGSGSSACFVGRICHIVSLTGCRAAVA